MSAYKITCDQCGSSDVAADFCVSIDANEYHKQGKVLSIDKSEVTDLQYFCINCGLETHAKIEEVKQND